MKKERFHVLKKKLNFSRELWKINLICSKAVRNKIYCYSCVMVVRLFTSIVARTS